MQHVYLIFAVAYNISNGNDGDEDIGSSTSDVTIVTTASSIGISMVIVAAMVILILLSYWCRHRRSNGK